MSLARVTKTKDGKTVYSTLLYDDISYCLENKIETIDPTNPSYSCIKCKFLDCTVRNIYGGSCPNCQPNDGE
jgi:hypothetical protein